MRFTSFQSAWSGNDYYENMKEESDIDDRVYLINKLGQENLLIRNLVMLMKLLELIKQR